MNPSNTTSISDEKTKEDRIPRPMNCYMLFRLEKQREIKSKCPGANHRDISKITSKWWRELSIQGKTPYLKEAERLKVAHVKKYPGYRFQPKKRTAGKRSYQRKQKPSDGFIASGEETRKELEALYNAEKIDSDYSISTGGSEGADNNLFSMKTKIRISRTNSKQTLRLITRSKSVDNILYHTDESTSNCKKSNRNRTVSTGPVFTEADPVVLQTKPLFMNKGTHSTKALHIPEPPSPSLSTCLSSVLKTGLNDAFVPSLANGPHIVVSDLPPPPYYICPYSSDIITTDRPYTRYNVPYGYYCPDHYPYVVANESAHMLYMYSAYLPLFPNHYYHGYQHSYSYSEPLQYSYDQQQQSVNSLQMTSPNFLVQLYRQ